MQCRGTSETRPTLSKNPEGFLLFGHHLDGDVGGDVGHQTDGDREVAHGLDGAERRTDLALLDLEAELVNRFSDVGVRDGTEQTAVNTGLALNHNGLTVELGSHVLSRSDAFSLGLFEFGTAGFEFSDGGLGGALGVTLRNQEVTGVAVLDLNDSAEFTEVSNFFEKNDLLD